MQEARIAIEQVVIPKGEPAELLPRPPHIVSLQIELIKKYRLQSEKVDEGSVLRLRILPFQLTANNDENSSETADANYEFDNFDSYGANGSHSVGRLPLLPD